MRVIVNGFEQFIWSAKQFLDTLCSGNLYGANLFCTATIGCETKSFIDWRKEHPSRLKDRLEKFDGYCLICGGELEATAGHPNMDCNSWTCESCGDITPEMGSLRLGD